MVATMIKIKIDRTRLRRSRCRIAMKRSLSLMQVHKICRFVGQFRFFRAAPRHQYFQAQIESYHRTGLRATEMKLQPNLYKKFTVLYNSPAILFSGSLGFAVVGSRNTSHPPTGNPKGPFFTLRVYCRKRIYPMESACQFALFTGKR
jgi:hypothetical protein